MAAICFCFSSTLQACVLTHTHAHILTSISIADFYLLCDLFVKVIVTKTPQNAAMLFSHAVQCHNNNKNNETKRKLKKTGHPVTCVSVCDCVCFCILCIALTFCGLRNCPWPHLSLYLYPALCLSSSPYPALSLSLDKFKLRN